MDRRPSEPPMICAWCKVVLDTTKSGHGICEACLDKHFPEDEDDSAKAPERDSVVRS